MSQRIQLGRTQYAVLAQRDVCRRPADLTTARGQAAQLHDASPHRLRDYLIGENLVGFGATRGDLVEVTARLLLHGDLVLLRDEPAPRPLDQPTVSDLVDPRAGPLVDPDPVQPPPVDTAETWVSFEVVDDSGAPWDGDFRCVVDGRTEAGSLLDGRQRYDPIGQGASAQLYIDLLRVPAEIVDDRLDDIDDDPASSDDPETPVQPPPIDGGDPATRPNFVSFEVVDEQGNPWPGTAEITIDGTPLQVPTGTPLQREVGPSAAVSVRLSLESPVA